MLAANAAGSVAAAELTDVLGLSDRVLMLIKRDARAGAPVSTWRKSAAGALVKARPQLALWRQLSIRRQVSLFASHPPSGLRARLIETHNERSASVTLDEATNESIDSELAAHAARAARDLRHM